MSEHDWIYDSLDGLVSLGNTVFDIGAHVGEYTQKFLDQINQTGKIIAFDLNPGNIENLIKRFGSTENVEIVHAAVTDRDGLVEYYKGKDSFTCNIVGHDTSFNSLPTLGSTTAIRLDTHYPDMVIDFMKIDVEGAEIRVLHGAEGIIKNVRGMLVECHFDRDWDELRRLVIDHYGYKGYSLKTGEPITPDSPRPYQLLLGRGDGCTPLYRPL